MSYLHPCQVLLSAYVACGARQPEIDGTRERGGARTGHRAVGPVDTACRERSRAADLASTHRKHTVDERVVGKTQRPAAQQEGAAGLQAIDADRAGPELRLEGRADQRIVASGR